MHELPAPVVVPHHIDIKIGERIVRFAREAIGVRSAYLACAVGAAASEGELLHRSGPLVRTPREDKGTVRCNGTQVSQSFHDDVSAS